jgi:hypothetical protein
MQALICGAGFGAFLRICEFGIDRLQAARGSGDRAMMLLYPPSGTRRRADDIASVIIVHD